MNLPKILMVNMPVHPIPPSKGAAVEWWMYQVAQRLRQYESHIACLVGPQQALEETDGTVHFHRIRFGRVYRRLFQKITRLDPYSYARRVASVIARVQPRVVHVHNAPSLFHELTNLTGTQQIRYVLHMHNDMKLTAMPPHTSLIACSQWIARLYATRVTCPIEVVTCGVDIERFQPAYADAARQQSMRREIGIPDGKKIVLYAGRVSPEKGTLDLVLAFRELLRRRQDIFLVLVGEIRHGSETDARARYGREILEQCAQMREACHVVGAVAPSRMQDYFLLGDLAVVPSEFEEPFGMVTIEAMAAGIPVLVARKGGLIETIGSIDNGFLIDDTKDHARLAQQLSELLDQPTQLQDTARRARRFVEQTYDWQRIAAQLETHYTQLLSTP